MNKKLKVFGIIKKVKSGKMTINVATDAILSLFNDKGTQEYCKCEEPDREAGYDYCFKCKRHVDAIRMEYLIKKSDEENY